ncbi:MAG: HI0074 family nucleotidyltransferase substrate-binding subunit [bacterium]
MSKYLEQIAQLTEATKRLSEVLALPKDSVIRDSAIQRFEFCMDLTWKTLKTHLEDIHGVIVKSPKETLRAAYQQGLIEYDSAWIEYVDLRNETVHTYNETLAEKTYQSLPKFLELLQTLNSKLTTP